MSKITSKITVPIILVGLFSMIVFVSLNYDQLDTSFYVILLFLSVYIFSFGFSVGQNFASPIKKLLDMATELSKGNLDTRVYLQTKDELADLAKVFNKIAEELQESHIDEKMIEKSVNTKTEENTRVLEETISALEQKIRNRASELEKTLAELITFRSQAKSSAVEVEKLKSDIDKLTLKLKKRKSLKKTKIAVQ